MSSIIQYKIHRQEAPLYIAILVYCFYFSTAASDFLWKDLEFTGKYMVQSLKIITVATFYTSNRDVGRIGNCFQPSSFIIFYWYNKSSRRLKAKIYPWRSQEPNPLAHQSESSPSDAKKQLTQSLHKIKSNWMGEG